MKSHSITLAVGITGNIGSGKTEVCKIFVSLGAKALYADELAKEVIASDAGVRKKLQKEFGDEIFLPDGMFDRRRMAALVFSNRIQKKKLDAIVHPPTLARIDRELRLEKTSGTYPVVVVEAALLFESGADRMFDYVIAVEATEEKAIKRVMKRDAMSSAEVKRRIQSQMPASEKVSKADFTIQNSGDLPSLERNCRFLFGLLGKMTPGTGTS